MIIKGGNEIIVYSVTEGLYHYLKLSAPILLITKEIIDGYFDELRCYWDFGTYISFVSFHLLTGAIPYFKVVYTNYRFEKSQFPDQKLLTGFSLIRVKYENKSEESYVLQFSNSILSFGTRTTGRFQVAESDYKANEIINIKNEHFCFWKKGQKKIIYQKAPINFIDVNEGKVPYESQDYLKSVKLDMDTQTREYYLLV